MNDELLAEILRGIREDVKSSKGQVEAINSKMGTLLVEFAEERTLNREHRSNPSLHRKPNGNGGDSAPVPVHQPGGLAEILMNPKIAGSIVTLAAAIAAYFIGGGKP